jgi:hypothetical protein
MQVKSGSHVGKEQTKEFGMLAVLVVSFIAFYFHRYQLLPVIFILALSVLLFPFILYPFAFVWLGFSKWVGRISTGILLGLIFFIIVTPIGLIRRLMKVDGLNINRFKKSRESVLTPREHVVENTDLMHTF